MGTGYFYNQALCCFLFISKKQTNPKYLMGSAKQVGASGKIWGDVQVVVFVLRTKGLTLWLAVCFSQQDQASSHSAGLWKGFPFEETTSGPTAAITGPYYHCRSNSEAGQSKVMARGTSGHFLALSRSESLDDPDTYTEGDNLAGGRKFEETKCPSAC